MGSCGLLSGSQSIHTFQLKALKIALDDNPTVLWSLSLENTCDIHTSLYRQKLESLGYIFADLWVRVNEWGFRTGSSSLFWMSVNRIMPRQSTATYWLPIQARVQFKLCTLMCGINVTTRKLCYRKDDRAMRPIYECPENFRDSLTTTTATSPNLWRGFVPIDSRSTIDWRRVSRLIDRSVILCH